MPSVPSGERFKLNNKINKIHERALRIAYKDYVSSFDILLERDKSVTIHTKNLQP